MNTTEFLNSHTITIKAMVVKNNYIVLVLKDFVVFGVNLIYFSRSWSKPLVFVVYEFMPLQ